MQEVPNHMLEWENIAIEIVYKPEYFRSSDNRKSSTSRSGVDGGSGSNSVFGKASLYRYSLKGEQKMFYESMGENFRAHTIQHAINTNSYDLQKASFSLSDEKLIKGTGSCNVCPFNSINQGSLFDH